LFADKLDKEIRAEVAREVRNALAKALGGRGARNRAATGSGRRSPTQIQRTAAKLLAYITKNPGQRSEQISQGTKLSTADMALPLKKLLTEKKIKAKGKARGTTYTAA